MSKKKDLKSIGEAYGDMLNKLKVNLNEDKTVPVGEVGQAPLESGGPEEKGGFRPSEVDINRIKALKTLARILNHPEMRPLGHELKKGMSPEVKEALVSFKRVSSLARSRSSQDMGEMIYFHSIAPKDERPLELGADRVSEKENLILKSNVGDELSEHARLGIFREYNLDKGSTYKDGLRAWIRDNYKLFVDTG